MNKFMIVIIIIWPLLLSLLYWLIIDRIETKAEDEMIIEILKQDEKVLEVLTKVTRDKSRFKLDCKNILENNGYCIFDKDRNKYIFVVSNNKRSWYLTSNETANLLYKIVWRNYRG